MKRYAKSLFLLLLAFVLCLAVFICKNFQNIADSPEKLNQLVMEELSYKQSDSTLSYLTQHEKEGEIFVWYVLQSNIDPDYRSYFVAKCKPFFKDNYQLIDIFTPQTYAKDILSVVWKGDYVLMVNNPDCCSIVQTDSSGKIIEQIDLSAESLPYIYYHNSPLPGGTITTFYDAEGNEIS